ncbi:hypothetical protein [Streptomyces sp. JV180]|uniref:hypothetical protein n=1 Tax=Streptomyces sp. JV180 TaxID=858634 RepID=UPI00168A8BEF|nr:hypothetical protein [Streptomyces sp. JV180]MBD3550007.1 hypothetical protein [Streptomyces sp. JV180]
MNDLTIDETGVLRRGKAPVSGVSVPGPIGYGSLLAHSLDYVVILHLLFSIAEGSSPTPLKVWKELQARGIKSSKNAAELVGKNAVYESFGRLIEAGLVRRVEVPNVRPGRRPTIAYDVYDNPAWNPDWQAQQVGSDPLVPEEPATGHSANPQVSPRPGTPDVAFGEADKPAGQPTSRNAGRGVRGTGVPERGARRVPAGQPTSGVPGRGKPSPPHPPEEEDSSSPNPLTRTTGPLPSQREEEREFAVEEIAAAQDFLQRMERWQAGLATARKCAPRLLRAMRTQGWPTLTTMDAVQRHMLEAEIFKNTGGAASWVKCLPGWVDDLCLYRPPTATAPAAGPAGGTAPQTAADLRAACPDCDPLGWVLDDDDDKPNRRCTHPGLAAETTEEQQ